MAVKKVEKTVASSATKEKVTKPKAVKAVVKKAPAKKVAEKVVKATASSAVKVATETVEKVEKIAKPKKVSGVYFYAVGRRKTSVAQVRLFEDDKATENDLVINDKKMKEYFPTISLQNNLMTPFKAVGLTNKFSMTVLVRGGGVTGQVEAVRLGIARALVKYNADLKKTLKTFGLMTRDAREVERKKAGLKKARKAPQWAKR